MNVRPRRGRRLAKRAIIAALCVAASGITVGLNAAPAAAATVDCAREHYLYQYWDQKTSWARQFGFSDATIHHYEQVANTHFARWGSNCL